MRPDFGPLWLAVSPQTIAVGIRRRLIVALEKHDFANAVACQRTIWIGGQRLLIFIERAREVALRDQLLATEDVYVDLHVRGVFQQPAVGVDGDVTRPPK